MSGDQQHDRDIAAPAGDGERAARRWRIAATILAVAALLAMVGVGALLVTAGREEPSERVLACVPNRDFTSTAKDKGPKCPPPGARYVDGIVRRVTEEGIELVTLDGQERTVAVRSADRPYIDVQHARSHAALGQPVRLYVKEFEGRDVVIYMVDPPL